MSLTVAREVLARARAALTAAEERLDGGFLLAVDLLAGLGARRAATTGLGKSGDVARKMAATLRATGTPASWLHPAEAAHGDLGLLGQGDVVVAVSRSGETAEVLALLPVLQALRCPVVALTGAPGSTLARGAAAVVDTGRPDEGGGLPYAATTSAAVALVMADALALAVAARRAVPPGELARLHPGGSLGVRLSLRVGDLLTPSTPNPVVPEGAAMGDAVAALDRARVGAVSVVDASGRLAGLVTDGDVRRALLARGPEVVGAPVGSLMTRDPVTVSPSDMAAEALRRMEDRPSQISVLPVVDPATGRPLAMLRLHDLVRAGVG